MRECEYRRILLLLIFTAEYTFMISKTRAIFTIAALKTFLVAPYIIGAVNVFIPACIYIYIFMILIVAAKRFIYIVGYFFKRLIVKSN